MSEPAPMPEPAPVLTPALVPLAPPSVVPLTFTGGGLEKVALPAPEEEELLFGSGSSTIVPGPSGLASPSPLPQKSPALPLFSASPGPESVTVAFAGVVAVPLLPEARLVVGSCVLVVAVPFLNVPVAVVGTVVELLGVGMGLFSTVSGPSGFASPSPLPQKSPALSLVSASPGPESVAVAFAGVVAVPLLPEARLVVGRIVVGRADTSELADVVVELPISASIRVGVTADTAAASVLLTGSGVITVVGGGVSTSEGVTTGGAAVTESTNVGIVVGVTMGGAVVVGAGGASMAGNDVVGAAAALPNGKQNCCLNISIVYDVLACI